MKIDDKKRASDRGGTKPINPEKTGATDRLHRRVEGLIASALRFGCDRVDVVHVPDASREIVISTLALRLSDEHTTARSLVDAIVLTLQDEASTLPAQDATGGRAWYAFSLRGMRSEDAAEVVRERVRLVGTAARPASNAQLATTAAGSARALAASDDHALELESGIAMHPREVATLSGVARQQMRHNEALVSTVVRGFGSVAEQQSKLVEQLSSRVVSLTERLEKQSDLFLDASRRARLVEAEARAEEAKGAAIQVGAEALKEFLPVALHRISRKYGLAGDAELDPMLERLLSTFTEDQLPALAAVLKPAQQAIFAEVWLTVQDRRAKAEAEQKKAAPPSSASSGQS